MPNNLTNMPKNFPKKSTRGFSLLEILLVLTIIAIMFGAIVAMRTPFQERMQLRNSALALQADLRLAQISSVADQTGRTFYGVRFYGGIGVDILGAGNQREGWKIVRYNLGDPRVLPITNFGIPPNPAQKSCVLADNPVIFDKTFFEAGITIAPVSELQIAPGAGQWHSIIFNERGQATSNGQTLLDDGQNLDDIILSGFGNTITIHITPMTGHVNVP